MSLTGRCRTAPRAQLSGEYSGFQLSALKGFVPFAGSNAQRLIGCRIHYEPSSSPMPNLRVLGLVTAQAALHLFHNPEGWPTSHSAIDFESLSSALPQRTTAGQLNRCGWARWAGNRPASAPPPCGTMLITFCPSVALQVKFVFMATQFGQAFVNDIKAVGRYVDLQHNTPGQKPHVTYGLLNCAGKPILEYWLDAAQESERLMPMQDRVSGRTSVSMQCSAHICGRAHIIACIALVGK